MRRSVGGLLFAVGLLLLFVWACAEAWVGHDYKTAFALMLWYVGGSQYYDKKWRGR